MDRQATAAAVCLAARLDGWKAARRMGVGQQLNVSSSSYLAPLQKLGAKPVAAVGFDLEELDEGESYGFADPPLEHLVALAQQGTVLVATWHADNPHTGGNYADRSWHDVRSLLDPSTPEYARFWADFDARLELLRRFQDAGVALVFRPLHEANGDWFWWSGPGAAIYKQLYAAMQARAWSAGIHDLLWGYSFNAVTGGHISAPAALLPRHVDLAGIDSYDAESPGQAKDRVPLEGYGSVATKVRRMAFFEVGPQDSRDGDWNPAVISRSARKLGHRPLWAMLWFDDQTGRKQISSLQGGKTWLGACPQGLCHLP